jgi:Zn-dependent protease with chaperone function
MIIRFLPSIGLMFLVACASTTDGGAVDSDRKQLMLIPSAQISKMAADAYEQTKEEARRKGSLDRNDEQVRKTQGIAKRLTPFTSVFRKDAPQWQWEVHVISSPELNAYCMPGGKIMFYTGIIEQLRLSDGEIAAVMGHEIAHALREHGRERMSQALIQQIGLGVLVGSGVVNEKYAGSLSMASQIMIGLPHSRAHEVEADQMGVELMARAGFDPREAITLWEKMAVQGGSKPPEILSTHPSDSTRIGKIQAMIPRVLPLYKTSAKM